MKKLFKSRCLALLLIAGLCTAQAMAGKAKRRFTYRWTTLPADITHPRSPSLM